ncbi:MAG: M15 family metallopeptidase [Oscillospiraceae bacterium]|nr:M15 family metallopeptidase [Oscillospiraceae bacterium]
MSKRNKRRSGVRIFLALLIIAGFACVWFVWGGRDQDPESNPERSDSDSRSEYSSTSDSESNSDSDSDSDSITSSMSSRSDNSTSSRSNNSAASDTGLFYEPEMPILVNRDNHIPDGYDPDLVSAGNGFYLSRKAQTAWNAMNSAAKNDGITLRIVSAYRSNERQTNNFNSKMQEYRSEGKTEEEAFALTAAYIAIPGTSEHTLGLAVDLNSLEQPFENTKEFRWLAQNSVRFGFIMRYPKEKVDITKINYEPWHFRYVGANHAAAMKEKNLVLEEYLKFS